YLLAYLPDVAWYTHMLMLLTTKAAEQNFPSWLTKHETAFSAIKNLGTSLECLTTINHDNSRNNKIYLTCDTSGYATGVVLSWGETHKTA
ncbi:hypothetical protein BDR06DRAFT_881081, partial [Suillus hirtellus]